MGWPVLTDAGAAEKRRRLVGHLLRTSCSRPGSQLGADRREGSLRGARPFLRSSERAVRQDVETLRYRADRVQIAVDNRGGHLQVAQGRLKPAPTCQSIGGASTSRILAVATHAGTSPAASRRVRTLTRLFRPDVVEEWRASSSKTTT